MGGAPLRKRLARQRLEHAAQVDHGREPAVAVQRRAVAVVAAQQLLHPLDAPIGRDGVLEDMIYWLCS